MVDRTDREELELTLNWIRDLEREKIRIDEKIKYWRDEADRLEIRIEKMG